MVLDVVKNYAGLSKMAIVNGNSKFSFKIYKLTSPEKLGGLVPHIISLLLSLP